jgi:glutathione S-transferase
MYRLHYYPANAAPPRICCSRKLARTTRSPSSTARSTRKKSEAYLKINSTGRIPALENDGTVLFEAAAIVLHIVDRHPEAGFAPKVGTPERAQFYQWLTYLTNSLQEELMLYQYPGRLAGDNAAAVTIVKQGAEARASGFLDVIEAHFAANGPFFLGAQISAADLYLTMLARWARPMTNPPRSRPHIARLLDAVIARPAVKRAYATEGISEQIC